MTVRWWTPDEIMTIEAARRLGNDRVCFVGIGLPSAAANLARLTHGPETVLIYESGTIGTTPDVLPLSIGDPELCERALTTVSVPEMFRYWLQGGRIDVGFLGAAEIDRFGNINTTVIGPYGAPKVRLPGAGGASEIAGSCKEVFVIARQTPRSFVEQVGFITSFGHGRGGNDRIEAGIRTAGPTLIVTDLCVMEPEAESREFVVTALHPGTTRDMVAQNTGWAVCFADQLSETAPPTPIELDALRALHARTAAAHKLGQAA
jgi:glutaconate CoA-transferase, subunit B